ncbi:unnamed protein product [Rotaria sp. Silwood1]|nr:unnamed protein product [Rotaria sp. Silwood1]
MSNLKESINENVNVPQGETAVCQNTITTDPLGPCLFVLIRCLRKERRLCLLYHHDFNKYDDSGKPQLIILKEFLMMICDGFKTDLGMTSLIPNCPPGNSGVKECLLAIGGGEIYEAERINRLFSFLLNHDKKKQRKTSVSINQNLITYKNNCSTTPSSFRQ